MEEEYCLEMQEIMSKRNKFLQRRGKWTIEEENYANRLIDEFKLGWLPLADGTTLRTFLSKLLNCDPMRISKKFVGDNCIGKQVFKRRLEELECLPDDYLQTTRNKLSDLERRFLERLAQTNRCTKPGGIGDKRNKLRDAKSKQAPWLTQPTIGQPGDALGWSSIQDEDELPKKSTTTRGTSRRHGSHGNEGHFPGMETLPRISSLDQLAIIPTIVQSGRRSRDKQPLVTATDTGEEQPFLTSNSPDSSVAASSETSSSCSAGKWRPAIICHSSDGGAHTESMNAPPRFLFSPRLHSSSPSLPHSSSVENFFMLVRSGDLPNPDANILNETMSMEVHRAQDSETFSSTPFSSSHVIALTENQALASDASDNDSSRTKRRTAGQDGRERGSAVRARKL